MPLRKYEYPTICSSVHRFIYIHECLFQRVNVSAVGEGKTIYLSLCLIVNPPNYKFCVCFCPSVCLCPCVRLLSASPPVCVFKSQIVCYSIGLYVFLLSFIRPSVLSSVRQFECHFLSLMHVCMFVIFLTSNFLLLTLTSNYDVYSRVCMRAYESVRLMRACI